MPNYGNAKPRPKSGAPKSGAGKSFGTRAGAAKPAGRAAGSSYQPREMTGERKDRGQNWAPRDNKADGQGARKPRYSADERSSRDARPASRFDDRAPRSSDSRGSDSRAPRSYDDRAPRRDDARRDAPRRDDSRAPRSYDDRAPRRFDDRAPRASDSRDARPASRFDDRAPRSNDSRGSDSRAPRSYDDRAPRSNDSGAPRREWSDKPRFGNGASSDRAPRRFDDRAPRQDRDGGFGGRSDSRPSSRPSYNSGSNDRDPYRNDRQERDRSRDNSFEGARDRNPNKKAFFEDKVLEKLVVADDAEVVSAGTFEEMGLHPRLVTALLGMGAETPFPIQQSTIPAALTGRDVLGRGKTGSGKTIAFAVPIITKLVSAGNQPRKPNKPRALILAPTRELADQIDRTVSALGRSVGFYTACVYGGVPQRRQEIAMSRGVDIVVATPGRLEDLIAQRIIDLSEVETMVVDEADHMCDLGFIEGVRRVMRATGDSQKLLFSATLDREVDALVKEFMPNPYVYEVPNETQETSTINHRILVVEPDDRSQVLLRLVQGDQKSLIFTRTKMTAERLSESLTNAGVPAARLHGDLNQNQRTRNLERFVKGQVRVLVATDVAARGIHVDDVALVIQVDPPEEYKTYLHRSGRTGRAGKEGTVITLIPRGRRRKVEDLLRRAERSGQVSEVRPSSELLEQLAGPIAPPPAPEVLDFGDSRGAGRGDRNDRPSSGRTAKRGNYGGQGKGRWADKPTSEKRPRAKKYV